MNSPTSTGRDSNCKGGSVSGEITSPMLVNTVRYQGKLRMSPASIPTSTGREVNCNGGNFSGETISRRSSSRRFRRGRFQPSGNKRLSSASQDELAEVFFSSEDSGLLGWGNIRNLCASGASTEARAQAIV